LNVGGQSISKQTVCIEIRDTTDVCIQLSKPIPEHLQRGSV